MSIILDICVRRAVRAPADGLDAARVAANLVPLAASAGALIDGSDGRVVLTVRPGLALPAVATAFGGRDPVAWPTDVHGPPWSGSWGPTSRHQPKLLVR